MDMNAVKFSWNTVFDTANNLMIHTFSERVEVTSNIKTGEIKVIKDGNVVQNLSNPAITAYESFLLDVAKDAKKLESFGHGE